MAVLINRSGIPTVEPTIRDTSLREHRIVASVPHRDVKVQINLERLLPLTRRTRLRPPVVRRCPGWHRGRGPALCGTC